MRVSIYLNVSMNDKDVRLYELLLKGITVRLFNSNEITKRFEVSIVWLLMTWTSAGSKKCNKSDVQRNEIVTINTKKLQTKLSSSMKSNIIIYLCLENTDMVTHRTRSMNLLLVFTVRVMTSRSYDARNEVLMLHNEMMNNARKCSKNSAAGGFK
jgi:hypothetical protein